MNAIQKSHLLFISGPSGAGKSAFIRQLRAGSLPGTIAAGIPANATNWAIVEANDITKGDLDETSVIARMQSGECLIVHYDIVFIHCYKKNPQYSTDQALAFLAHAEKIHSVLIRPQAEVLQKQFAERSAQIQQRKTRASRLWTTLIRTPIRKIRSLIKPKKTTNTKSLYRRDGFIKDCYQQWEKHLSSIASSHPLASHITIEPAPRTSDRETFQLVSHHSSIPTLTLP